MTRLKEKIENLKSQCAKLEEEIITERISKLLEEQKEAVRAIIAASKVKNLKGMCFQSEWISECLLLRIKSRKAYNHLFKNRIIVLPCLKTLKRYMKFLKSQYGFQNSIFTGIKKKTENMSPQDADGIHV